MQTRGAVAVAGGVVVVAVIGAGVVGTRHAQAEETLDVRPWHIDTKVGRAAAGEEAAVNVGQNVEAWPRFCSICR